MSNTNIPVMSVERIIECLSQTYVAALNRQLSPKHLPSVMLWGESICFLPNRLMRMSP